MNAPGRRFPFRFNFFFLYLFLLFFFYAVKFHVAVRELFHASRCMKCNSNRNNNIYIHIHAINLLNEMPVVVNHQCKCCSNNRWQCRKFPRFTLFPFRFSLSICFKVHAACLFDCLVCVPPQFVGGVCHAHTPSWLRFLVIGCQSCHLSR